jgi:TolA-binding protein
VISACLCASAGWAGETGIKLKEVKEEAKPVRGRTGPADFKAPVSLESDADQATERKRDEMIEQLKQIIPDMPESDSKADLYFQLAEAYWEKSRYVSLQEMKEYEDAYQKWMKAREHGQTTAEEPKAATRKSDAHRKEALLIYQKILDAHRQYPRRDEVLFAVAYNQYDIGSKRGALEAYHTLVKQYPASKLVPDAYVQLGEHYFAANDLRRARAAYQKAADFKLPKLYGFALYKLAWCDYNVQDYEGSIQKFKEVIAYADAQARAADKSRDRVQLRLEALKDIVLAYAQIDAIDSAISYLREKGGEKGFDYVNRLAATYFDSGKLEASIRVYRLLIAESPRHVRAPAWQQKILLAYDKLNKRDKVLAEMKNLVKGYGPQSEWAKANAEHTGALVEATELAQGALSQLVQDYHQEALKTKSVATYRLARDIYREYLTTFPQAEDAYNLRFLYAETLYALDQWADAAEQYARVVDEGPQGTYRKQAAYDAILALEKEVAVSKGKLRRRELGGATKIDVRRDKGKVEEKRKISRADVTRESAEQAIPALELKLLAACEKYLSVVPDSKDEQVIRYKAAFIYYDHRHYVEAAKRFGDIILRWPAGAEAQKAADLSLDILNTKEEWLALSELAIKFRDNARLSKPGSDFHRRVSRLGEGARFKYVMDLYEKKKDYPLSAGEFRKFVDSHPTSEYAPLALFNALIIADKADQLDLEIEAGERLMRNHSAAADPKLLPRVVLALASAYERSAQLAKAIEWSAQYAERWPDDAKAADQLFNAAVWRERLGDDKGALADWQRYLERYKDRSDAANIAFNVGLLHERRKEWRKAAEHWSGYQREYSKPAKAGQLFLARYKEGIALQHSSKADPDVGAILSEVARRYPSLPDAEKAGPPQDAAAHARFLLMEPRFHEFMKIHFNYTRQKDLAFVLKIKNARLKRLIEGYTEVDQIGSPRWSVASLARVGEAYRNFNKGLMDAPMPRGLDAEQQDLYRNTLEQMALPLEDKAVDAFDKAVAIAARAAVYSEWTLRAQDQLRELKPDSFGDIKKPALLASEPQPAAIAPDAARSSGSGGY